MSHSTVRSVCRNVTVWGSCGVLVLLSAWVNAQDVPDQAASTAPARHWEPFWGKRVTGYLKAADGTSLRYSVLLPKGEGKYPVILKYSGYDSGSIGGSAYLADDETFSVGLDKALLEHGYAVMGVSARGTGCSQGQFDFLGRAYGTDGRDAVEFAAAQPWSTGAIGMANWSWAGMSQLKTAAERPLHLKAIAPGMALGEPRGDSWAPGAVPAPEFVTGWHWYLDQRWKAVRASAETEKDARCLAQLDRNDTNVRKVSLMVQLATHPLRDAWIESRSIRAHTDQIQVPILSMEAWQDEAVMAREGYYHETVDPKRLYIVQTNGQHDLYESLHFRDKLIRFFDRFVKGEQNGFDKQPRVEIWQETTAASHDEHAINEQATPGWTIQRGSFPVAVTPAAFVLGEGHRLVRDGAPGGEPDEYRYPVAGPDVNTYEVDNAWGDQKPGWKEGSVAYTSPPLADDMVVYGPASADLWLSTSLGPDADVQVTLTQVLADGQEVYVQRGWLRLSARQLDASRSTALRPWLLDTPESIQPLYPDEPVLGRVELSPFSHVFRKGSQVRIWIDAPGRTGGYGFDSFSLPAVNKVLHDGQHPSRLMLGVLGGVTVPTTQPPCGSLLKQPCRPDPLK